MLFSFALSQSETQKNMLKKMSSKFSIEFNKKKQEALEYSKTHNVPIRIELDSTLMELMYIDERGNPQYYATGNANAASTISTDKVHAGGVAGLSLDGSGLTIGEWDGGSPLTTHQEFGSRVTVMDGGTLAWHATHVAGTIMASGMYTPAKGMATAADLSSWEWNYDVSEMAMAAAEGLQVSNHSYGYIRGWNGGVWYGDPSISTLEDYRFGFYDINTKNWDEVGYNAPYYIIVKSSGNDRGDSGDGSYPPDGPYDCISQQGVAKNILTVGAVGDIVVGYTQPSDVVMSSFSSWGPTDDGRIKPDIVANGIALTSTYSSADDAYSSSSGTSMSTPSVAGSVALLMQQWENVNGAGSKMRSATVKALIINTADEAGTTTGPDYEYGWGLMNTEKAAIKISEDTVTDVITEYYLTDGDSYTRNITTNGTSPVRVTLVWTDPPGTPPAVALDPPDTMLVNDLDLHITESANTYYPWKLDRDNPSDAATNSGENNVDNVECVDISSPVNATTYTIIVDHDGSLVGGGQAFSLVISGDISNVVSPEADFYADNTQPTISQEVSFIDASANNPVSWNWTFTPSTVEYLNGTTSESQNPQIRFDQPGSYQVSLLVTNSSGSDTETKSSYINVGSTPLNYCEAYSMSAYGFINRVQIGSIDTTSWFANVGGPDPDDLYYQDITNLSTDMTVGESYNIIVTNYYSDSDIDLAIWVDWNRDGDFEDSDEEVLCEVNNGGQGTFAINVPSDAATGNTRMRLRTKWVDSFGCLPCGTTYEGEVEDYTLNIEPASTTWIGITTDWNNTLNWSEGIVPTLSYEVIIPTSPTGGNFPVIQSAVAAKCYNIILQENAVITVNGSLELEN